MANSYFLYDHYLIRVTKEVSSGSCVVNDTLYQFANLYAPFGGVGESGMGGYHGTYYTTLYCTMCEGCGVIV